MYINYIRHVKFNYNIMKIRLDTTAKTIEIVDSVKLSELFEMLEKLLPNGDWKKFKLETISVINNWTNPIVVPVTMPPTPYTPPIWYCGNTDMVATFNNGTYNIEC